MILEEVGVAKNIFGGFFSRLVKTIHVELPDETVDIFVSKIFGEDGLLELLDILDCEFLSVAGPLNNFGILAILR